MPKDVEEIRVYLTTNRRVTVAEARQLQVYASEKLLRAINAHKKIRPFLREYPFTPVRARVHISYDNEFIGPFADGTLCYVSTIQGNIYYYAFDPITQKKHIEVFSEPYEEAVKIAPFSSLKPEELRIHRGPAYEKHVDLLLYNFSKEAYEKWNLYCCKYGGKMVNGIEEFAIKFVTDKRTPLEKARVLHIAVTERFNELINSDPVLRPDLKEYPLPIRHTKVYISFKERNGCYYEDGTVAYVNQENDTIYYSTEPPTVFENIPLHPPLLHEERYEDAKKIIQKASSKG